MIRPAQLTCVCGGGGAAPVVVIAPVGAMVAVAFAVVENFNMAALFSVFEPPQNMLAGPLVETSYWYR